MFICWQRLSRSNSWSSHSAEISPPQSKVFHGKCDNILSLLKHYLRNLHRGGGLGGLRPRSGLMATQPAVFVKETDQGLGCHQPWPRFEDHPAWPNTVIIFFTFFLSNDTKWGCPDTYKTSDRAVLATEASLFVDRSAILPLPKASGIFSQNYFCRPLFLCGFFVIFWLNPHSNFQRTLYHGPNVICVPHPSWPMSNGPIRGFHDKETCQIWQK